MELWPIRAVAEILGRSPVTVRRWERQGLLPRLGRKQSSDARGRRRLYRYDELCVIAEIADEEGMMANKHVHPSHTHFPERVRAALRALPAAPPPPGRVRSASLK